MCSYTIPTSIVAALEERSRETGENKSRLAEQAMRLLLALPAEVREEDEDEIGSTKNEAIVLQQLKKMSSPGPHLTFDVGQPCGVTFGPTLRALRGLERRGEVFCWGAGKEAHDGSFTLAWSLMDPMGAVKKALTGWRKGNEGEPEWARIALVRKLALSIDAVGKVRDLGEEVTGLAAEDLAIENIRERVERLNAIERARLLNERP